MTHPLPIGPVLLALSLFGAAFAGDPAVAPMALPGATVPPLDYLLTLGPYGALVWGAYMVGRGLKITVAVELSETDREALARALRSEPGGKRE